MKLKYLLDGFAEYLGDIHCEFERRIVSAIFQLTDGLPANPYPETEYVNYLMTHSWGQKVIRFYDPDGNLIEVGTPV